MNKSIITVVGRDGIGIIARICSYISERGISILDITQTLVGEYFNMMMIVGTDSLDCDYAAFVRGFEKLGEELGVEIRCQRSDIFDKMHRI